MSISQDSARGDAASASMKAALLMVFAMLCFALMNGIIRLLAGALPVIEDAPGRYVKVRIG